MVFIISYSLYTGREGEWEGVERGMSREQICLQKYLHCEWIEPATFKSKWKVAISTLQRLAYIKFI